jgi:hypothetical protein
LQICRVLHTLFTQHLVADPHPQSVQQVLVVSPVTQRPSPQTGWQVPLLQVFPVGQIPQKTEPPHPSLQESQVFPSCSQVFTGHGGLQTPPWQVYPNWQPQSALQFSQFSPGSQVPFPQ